MSSPKPKLTRKFSFEYEAKRGQSSVDDILDSMNRTARAGEILDYDPEVESYLEQRVGNVDDPNRHGKAVFGFMLLLGVGALWFYGGLARVMDSAWLGNRYNILGEAVPLWMGLSVIFLFVLGALVARHREPRLEIER